MHLKPFYCKFILQRDTQRLTNTMLLLHTPIGLIFQKLNELYPNNNDNSEPLISFSRTKYYTYLDSMSIEYNSELQNTKMTGDIEQCMALVDILRKLQYHFC